MSPDDPYLTFRRTPAALDRIALEAFAEQLHSAIAPRLNFHCLIATDAELRRLNLQFRGKDYATDVLSFPESNDIAVSWQRARDQAAEWGHSLPDELRVLILHGVLHLLGLDHETDRGEMAEAESEWRDKLGLPNSLIARSQ